MEKLKKINHIEFILNKIFKELHNKKLDDIIDLKINNDINFVELEDISNNIGINLSEENINNMSWKNKYYICSINIDYKIQYCLIRKLKNKYEVQLEDKKINFLHEEFIELQIQKIWSCKKSFINNHYMQYKLDIKDIKLSYVFICIFINLFLFILMIITNMYLKIILQSIIPNDAMYDFIFLSVLFLLIFILSTCIESFLTLYKSKKVNYLNIKYLSFFLDNLLKKNNHYFKENNKDNLLINLKSFFPIINRQIFHIPDFISSLLILFFSITIIGSISYYLFLISFISMIFHLIIFIFKSNEIKRIGNYNIEKESILENNINSYIQEIRSGWDYRRFNNFKNSIITSWAELQNESLKNSLNKEKILIWEKIGNKIIFVFYSIISVFFIIYNKENFSIGNMIFTFTLINMINNNSESIFSFISNHSFYKIHFKNIEDFIQKNIDIKGEIKLLNNVSNINFKDFSLKNNDKFIFKKLNKKINNNTLISGKNGIGKTSILKSIFPNDLSKNIYINDISINSYNYESMKEKIIYLNNKSFWNELDINKLIHFDKSKTNKILKFLKMNNILQIINNEEKSLGEYQILSFLSIIHEKDKILLFDEALSNVNSKVKIDILKTFKSDLLKNNFIIWVSHDKKIKKYFKYNWEIKNV